LLQNHTNARVLSKILQKHLIFPDTLYDPVDTVDAVRIAETLQRRRLLLGLMRWLSW